MKLAKKILPIATIVATGCAIAPIAVSCSNHLQNKKEVEGLTVDIQTLMEGGFKRTIAPSIIERTSPEAAMSTYLTTLDKNPNLFAEDIFDFWGNVNRSEQISPLPTGSTGKITVGNISIDGEANKTLSYAIHLNGSIPSKVQPEKGKEFDFTSLCDIVLQVNKVPVYCDYQGSISQSDINMWAMLIDFGLLVGSTTNWSISLTGTIDTISSSEQIQGHTDISFILDKNVSEIQQTAELIGIALYLQHPMMYFQNTKRSLQWN